MNSQFIHEHARSLLNPINPQSDCWGTRPVWMILHKTETEPCLWSYSPYIIILVWFVFSCLVCLLHKLCDAITQFGIPDFRASFSFSKLQISNRIFSGLTSVWWPAMQRAGCLFVDIQASDRNGRTSYASIIWASHFSSFNFRLFSKQLMFNPFGKCLKLFRLCVVPPCCRWSWLLLLALNKILYEMVDARLISFEV